MTKHTPDVAVELPDVGEEEQSMSENKGARHMEAARLNLFGCCTCQCDNSFECLVAIALSLPPEIHFLTWYVGNWNND